MSVHERLEFKLGEYLLRASSVNLKCLGEACFRDDIARTNAVHARDRYDLFEDIVQGTQEDFAQECCANRAKPPNGGAPRRYRCRKKRRQRALI